MKKYVFFTFAIYGIGGTQIYVRNKARYMQNHGWKTYVVSTEPGDEIIVKDLETYKAGLFPELLRTPYLYYSFRRKSILKKLKEYVDAKPEDEIVIESNYMGITPWAELFAEYIRAQNFVFLIQEDYTNIPRKYLDFFSYKYDRGELAANTPQALSILFNSYREIEKSNYLLAICSNVVEDCPSILNGKLYAADYFIGSIGRINKPFVVPMLNDVVEYAKSHSDKEFQMVFFGGSPNKSDINTINRIVEETPNLRILITGPLFPIPKKDITAMDVCISSAGAAHSSANIGCKTIVIDALDFKPIGILGYTTNNDIHRVDEPQVPLSNLLDEILIKKTFKNQPPKLLFNRTIENIDKKFDEHEDLRKNAHLSKSYYNIKKMAPKFITRLAYKILGGNILRYLFA